MAKFNFSIPDDNFTFFDDVAQYVCNNCGANARTIEEIEHFENCRPNESKKWEANRIPDPFKFILAGKAIFTITSFKTGKRFTFKVNRKREKGHRDVTIWFVRVLTGSDNNSDYEYLGTIFGDTLAYVHGRKSRISREALSNKAFSWMYNNLLRGKDISNKCSIHHEGRCGKCGRRLTVPESIESGYGPECIGKV